MSKRWEAVAREVAEIFDRERGGLYESDHAALAVALQRAEQRGLLAVPPAAAPSGAALTVMLLQHAATLGRGPLAQPLLISQRAWEDAAKKYTECEGVAWNEAQAAITLHLYAFYVAGGTVPPATAPPPADVTERGHSANVTERGHAAAQPPTDVIDVARVVRGLSAFQAVELAKWHDAEATRLLGELQRAHQRQMAELVNRYESARTDWQNTGCPFCPRCGYPDPDTRAAAAQPGEEELDAAVFDGCEHIEDGICAECYREAEARVAAQPPAERGWNPHGYDPMRAPAAQPGEEPRTLNQQIDTNLPAAVPPAAAQPADDQCPECRGSGRVKACPTCPTWRNPALPCPECGGTRQVPSAAQPGERERALEAALQVIATRGCTGHAPDLCPSCLAREVLRGTPDHE